MSSSWYKQTPNTVIDKYHEKLYDKIDDILDEDWSRSTKVYEIVSLILGSCSNCHQNDIYCQCGNDE